MLDPEIAKRFAPFLGSGEIVRWTGHPPTGLVFTPTDFFLIPFGLLWAGFVIVWEGFALLSGQWFMILWGVPFVAVGFYIVVGRFLVDAHFRKRTAYALTQSRALILDGWKGTSLTSVDLKRNAQVRYRPGGEGRGTITFGESPFPFPTMIGRGMWAHPAALPEFFRVQDAEAAYRIVQDA